MRRCSLLGWVLRQTVPNQGKEQFPGGQHDRGSTPTSGSLPPPAVRRPVAAPGLLLADTIRVSGLGIDLSSGLGAVVEATPTEVFRQVARVVVQGVSVGHVLARFLIAAKAFVGGGVSTKCL